MRPAIDDSEIKLLKQDLDRIDSSGLVGIEAYEALQLLKMRRQTEKQEALKRMLGKECGAVKNRRSGRLDITAVS